MALTNSTRSTRATLPGKSKRARLFNANEGKIIASDGLEENATKANQAEDEEIAEEISNTTSKLEELKVSGGSDEWASRFSKTLTANKTKFMAKLDEAAASITEQKDRHEEELLKLLRYALGPLDPGAGPLQPGKPFDIAQVTKEGQPLYQRSTSLLTESKSLLKTYNELATAPLAPSPLAGLSIQHRNTSDYTEKVLAAGKKLAKSDIENMLADRCNEVRGTRNMSKDEEELGQVVFDEAQDQGKDIVMEGIEGWGEVAHRTNKAALKMEKAAMRERVRVRRVM